MSVEMKIKGLMIDPVSNMPIIVLKDAKGEQVLPIWVGIFEANAIAMQIEEVVPPRPYTHDLLRNIIRELETKVEKIVITELRDNTFFARIHLDHGGKHLEVDARPSDAMALALRAGVPIYVDDSVLERSSVAENGQEPDETERLRRWLEQVDPEELGKYEM